MNHMALWVALAATPLGTLFASLRTSLTTLSRGRLADLASARAGGSVPPRIARIIDEAGGYARAMALPQMLCVLTIVISITWWLLGLRSAETLGLIEALLGGAIAAVWLWLFVVIVPTSIAQHAGERLVLAAAGVVRAVYVLEAPLRIVVPFADEIVRRLAGAEKKDDHEELEQEILSMIDEGEREGAIDESEREMIEAVVEFRSTTVEQIMTPRTEVDALEATDDLKAIIAFVKKVGHSRIPVYQGDLDHVLGILYAKDLLRWVANGKEAFAVRDVLRPANFVPETKTVRELLGELIAQKVHIALVADEYGGTSGLVTIEDIIEEVFGEIQDEYEPEDEAPPKIDVLAELRGVEADARAYLDDVNDALEPFGFELPETDDYDTLAGFVITTLGRIPDAGETFEHKNLRIAVLEATPTRVMRVRIEGVEPPSDGQATPEAEEAAREAAASRGAK
jgi:putative hemolysin